MAWVRYESSRSLDVFSRAEHLEGLLEIARATPFRPSRLTRAYTEQTDMYRGRGVTGLSVAVNVPNRKQGSYCACCWLSLCRVMICHTRIYLINLERVCYVLEKNVELWVR